MTGLFKFVKIRIIEERRKIGGADMGTFLYEYVNQPHFENENELKLRLKDILIIMMPC